MTTQPKSSVSKSALGWCLGALCALFAGPAFASPGAIWTTQQNGTTVNANLYDSKDNVYLNGGPQNAGGKGIPDGIYYFHVVDPSGAVELSQDALECRTVQVIGGVIKGAAPGPCPHPNGTANDVNGGLGVKLMPYADTPNNGGEYKVEITPVGSYGKCGDLYGFCDKKSDNFKVALPKVAYVTACKWNDLNGNGVQDIGEPVLPNWPMTVSGVDGGTQTAVTDNTGCVAFAVSSFPGTSGGSPAATVTVQEGKLGVNWVQKAPAPNSSGVRSGTSPAYTVDGSGIVTSTDVRPGDDFNIDFGNFNPDCPTAESCIPDTRGRAGVVKDANPSYKITWGLEKSVDKKVWNTSDSAQPTYTVTVTHDTGSAFTVEGTITMINPTTIDVVVTSVTDAVDNGGDCVVTDGTNIALPAGERAQVSYICTYSSLPPAGTNTVSANWTDGTASGTATGTAPVDFANATVVDGTVTVTDSMAGDLGTVSYTDPSPKVFTYQQTLSGSPGTCVDKPNTATVHSTTPNTAMEDLTADATVKICSGVNPKVEKTATPSFKRSYAWKIEKSVDQTTANIAAGGTATFNYKVTATQTGVTDSDWKVTGTIKVTNNNDFADMNVNLADVLPNASCTIEGGSSLSVPKSGSATVNYTCTFASAPAAGDMTNTATATWDAATYGTPGNTASGTATTAFGDPTSTVDKVIQVKDVWNNGTPTDFGTLTGTASEPFTTQDFTYSKTVSGVAGTCTNYDNTATFTSKDTSTTGSASKSVKVCVGSDLSVSKTAKSTFVRNYTWTISKSADKTRVETTASSTTFNYTIVATQTGVADSGWGATGTITVSNPNDWEAITVTLLSDSIDNGGSCTIDGGVTSFSVPASGTVKKDYTCTYASAPSASSFTNTAMVTWDKAAASTPTGTASGTATGNFNTPNSKTNDTITVTDAFNGGSGVTLGTVTGTNAAPYATQTFTDSKTVSGTAGTCVTYNNTAAFTGNSGSTGSDSKTVTLCVGKDLVVAKTAAPSYARQYYWNIAKVVDQNLLILGGTVNYTITVNETGVADGGWAVTGSITVTNPNDWEAIGVSLADAISNGGSCSITDGATFSVAAGATVTKSYTCTYTSAPSTAFTNTATATVTSGVTPSTSASGEASGTFSAPTTVINKTITVTDTMQGTLGTVTGSDYTLVQQLFTYPKTLGAPVDGCQTLNNTATIVETSQSASAVVSSCGLGERTIGYWQNKNGQGVISGANQAALGAWLRQFNPFSNAPSSNVAAYVKAIIKDAKCGGPTCNAMLRAQMLGTALSVYFTDDALGGNVFGTPIPVGSALISLVNPNNVSAAFGGATQMTIMETLLYQNVADPAPDSGANWYGQVKALQTLASGLFDTINNGHEVGP